MGFQKEFILFYRPAPCGPVFQKRKRQLSARHYNDFFDCLMAMPFLDTVRGNPAAVDFKFWGNRIVHSRTVFLIHMDGLFDR